MDVDERTVAGWVLEQRLGAGGFGEVWRAHRQHAGLIRALKLVPVANPRAFTSWRHEIDRLEELSHPNIVRFYDADVVVDPASRYDGYAWIATELCDRSLADELDHWPGYTLGDKKCGALLVQMLDALAAAHGRSVVHRDVKPANILWHTSGVWKLADFGTARLVPDGAGQLRTAVVGTVPYMSPAAHRGRQDYAADLYALGVTIHEALCGEWLHPRPGSVTDSEYIKLILDTEPRISPVLSTRWRTVVAALAGSYGPVDAATLLEWFQSTGGSAPPPPPSPVALPHAEPSTGELPPTAPHDGPTSAPGAPAAPVPATGSPAPHPPPPDWWDGADVPDTNVDRTHPHHPSDPRRTVRQPTSPLPPATSRSRGRRRRGSRRDVPVGPLVVFGGSGLLAAILLAAAGIPLGVVFGVVVGAIVLILLIMALN